MCWLCMTTADTSPLHDGIPLRVHLYTHVVCPSDECALIQGQGVCVCVCVCVCTSVCCAIELLKFRIELTIVIISITFNPFSETTLQWLIQTAKNRRS